jgi:hypothetical protein
MHGIYYDQSNAEKSRGRGASEKTLPLRGPPVTFFQRFEGGDRSCPQDISCPSIASVFLPIIWAERMGKRKTSIQEAQAHV